MPRSERCRDTARNQPPTPELLLAAVERAVLHRPGGGSAVTTRTIVEHLDLAPRSAAARGVRAQLGALAEDGAIEACRRHGVAAWGLTPAGRRRLAGARRRDTLPALPESPQHRAWRRARTLAALEIERFRSALADETEEARRMLERDPDPGSDAWFELGERLARDCRLLGSASHCLYEWPEPPEDRADVDDRLQPGEEALEGAERARRWARRRGRRNVSLWAARG